jgi:carbonic anhydrase
MRTFLAICLFAVATSAAADCANYTYCEFWHGACANGVRQSPIANNASGRKLDRNLKAPGLASYRVHTAVSAMNTKTTIKVKAAKKTIRLVYAGENWDLDEFHFHVPAEHVLDVWNKPRRAVAELHLVHKNHDKTMAIAVAVPIYLGGSNPALKALKALGSLPSNCDPKESGADAVSMIALLPANTGRYITYEGSLTTPPCDEVVRFLLMNNGITATQDEIDYIKITMNARPAQYNPNPVTYRRGY